jgi:FdrA protein
MTTRVVVKKATYRDSISLMKISNAISSQPGVRQAAVVMATELNRRVLSEAGFQDDKIGDAASDDMIVAIESDDEASLEAALREMEAMLSHGDGTEAEAASPKSLEEALEIAPDSNLAVISVPGRFAKREAMRALSRGLNVFLFSSNVSREEELEMKRVANEKGLLLMGPDCGTSIIGHKVLGFGNVIRAGAIGLVSASGTGLQEVTTLIHKAGLGISQAIGTGGADVSEEVGGITMIQGIGLLEADEQTKVIVLISKPPAGETAKKVLEAVARCKKPVVVNFLGAEVRPRVQGNLRRAANFEEAAETACELAGMKAPASAPATLIESATRASEERKRLSGGQRYVRGLFSGGSLCYEAEITLKPLLGRVYSNVPVSPQDKVSGEGPSGGHTCIDMGAEEFVEGRAHPMIDFTLRNSRILREARDPETAVILLDVELGYGSNADPAGQLVPFILRAKALAAEAGRYLPVVASVVGTDGDFQGLAGQVRALSEAGTLVMPTSAQAATVAALIASGSGIGPTDSGRPD